MERPQGKTHIVEEIKNARPGSSDSKSLNGYKKMLPLSNDLRERISHAAKEKGMNDTVFIRYCITEQLEKMGF
ncbi:hypothetical protein [Methanosphaera sp.]|uniref:hypothetical protein n=1 Tax=Methanosphaera sp. TaxID=2666342 RepID=UPI0025E49623|nr:hypothetical protein [Methanosphaera sp.]